MHVNMVLIWGMSLYAIILEVAQVKIRAVGKILRYLYYSMRMDTPCCGTPHVPYKEDLEIRALSLRSTTAPCFPLQQQLHTKTPIPRLRLPDATQKNCKYRQQGPCVCMYVYIYIRIYMYIHGVKLIHM